MELHKAIKEIVASKGPDMICNLQIINYLLDYQAFKEKPATKLILKAIIDSGYAENILALCSNISGWETKFKQYQHDFIDSCGYKEELAAYVFESIAYGLGLNTENEEPEIKPAFNVDSFFDIPEEIQTQQPSAPQPQQKPSADPSDLYTIALSFFKEGKYVQARGFMIKALGQYPNYNVPSLYLKLMGDISMKMDFFQEALKYYNESFTRKAAEMKVSVADLRESLKQHKVKGYENSMFCYFFCMYCENQINNAQWRQFVKEEARYGLMEAIQYCAKNNINPIEEHYDIFFVDKNNLRTEDYLYSDGTFAHELSSAKKIVARVLLAETSEYEKSQGWKYGYLIPVKVDGSLYMSKSMEWSTKHEDLPFPHSHYTNDDINHWDKLKTIQSEHYITINNYDIFPVFRAIKNFPIKIPISGASPWFLPSIHWFKRCGHSNMIYGDFWTSSQADSINAIHVEYHLSSYKRSYYTTHSFKIEDKMKCKQVLPVSAF